MSEISNKNKKRLVLVSTKEDVKVLLNLINKFKKSGKEFIVLGVDQQSWIELREKNIQFKMPMDYFDKSECDIINTDAKNLACSWYKPIDEKITYHNISLGEMEEYSFYHLLIGALRDIKIANKVFDFEKPNEIYLPKKFPLYGAFHVRYENLLKVISYLAKLKSIPISYYDPGKVERKGRKSNILFIIRDKILEVLNKFKKLRSKTKESFKYKYKIAFFQVPLDIFLSIKRELEKSAEFTAINVSANEIIAHSEILDEKIKELVNPEHDFKKNEKITKNLIYDNISLVEVLSNRFSRFFHDQINLIKLIDGTENFIQREKPAMSIVMYDVPNPHRLITKICKYKGIPTLVIQHGLYITDQKGLYVMPKEADKHAGWGNSQKEWAIERGKPPETQVITGNPKWDSKVLTKVESIKSKFSIFSIYKVLTTFLEKFEWHLLRINPRKKIVVIATQYFMSINSCYTVEQNIAFIRESLNAMIEIPKVQVIVKLHPNFYEEFNEITKTILRDLQLDSVRITSRNLWELLKICDLLITQTSTVGLEAMLFDKPIVTYISNGNPNLNPYAGSNAVIEVYKKENLVSAIKDALFNEEVQMRLAVARKKFLYENAYLLDGKASYRIAKLIQTCVKK